MHFLPILSTLRRHKTAALLIVLEIALTCAIVCNAVFLIRERLARVDMPSGIAENELVAVELTGIGTSSDAAAVTQQDFAALRAIPGVKSVANTNMVPFGGNSWNSDVGTTPPESAHDAVNTAMYMGSEDLLETFGLQISAGRDFNHDEYADFSQVQKKTASFGSVIVTRALGEKLFPGKSPLGQKVYVWGDEPQTIVGVIDHIARPNEVNGAELDAYSMFLPITMPFTVGNMYLLRVDPARKGEVLKAVDGVLDKVDPARIILKRQPFAEIRTDFFSKDRAMAYLLVGVSLALLVITALGVVGLASFWVQQRTRQIGIRRALGATRADIRRYFQLENFILATAGIVLGMMLAYGMNLFLMHKYHVARLPAEFLPIGAALLWGLGQIAVLGPAMRAATIPPAIATRSV
jgi:putative ABC transport system permease protein